MAPGFFGLVGGVERGVAQLAFLQHADELFLGVDLALDGVIGHGASAEAGLAVLQPDEGELSQLAFGFAKGVKLVLGCLGSILRLAGGGQGGGFLFADELADAFGLFVAGFLSGQGAFDGGVHGGVFGLDEALLDEVGEVCRGFERGLGARLLGQQLRKGGRKVAHLDFAGGHGGAEHRSLLGKVGGETTGLADQVAIELEAQIGGAEFGGFGFAAALARNVGQAGFCGASRQGLHGFFACSI